MPSSMLFGLLVTLVVPSDVSRKAAGVASVSARVPVVVKYPVDPLSNVWVCFDLCLCVFLAARGLGLKFRDSSHICGWAGSQLQQ